VQVGYRAHREHLVEWTKASDAAVKGSVVAHRAALCAVFELAVEKRDPELEGASAIDRMAGDELVTAPSEEGDSDTLPLPLPPSGEPHVAPHLDRWWAATTEQPSDAALLADGGCVPPTLESMVSDRMDAAIQEARSAWEDAAASLDA